MRREALHVVVSTTSKDAQVRALADALSIVLSELHGTPHAESPHASATLPIAMPAESEAPVSVEGADIVVALDAVALDNTRHADVGLRVAFWPGLGDAWDGSVELADLVLVAHETQVEIAVSRGAVPTQVGIVGPLAVATLPSLEEAREKLLGGAPEVSRDAPILLVPTECLPGADLTKMLTQLALVRAPFLTLFDVGDDVERAKDLRQLVPRFGIHAALLSEPDVSALAYRAASRVVATLDGPSALRAVTSETPLLVLKKRAREQVTVDALEVSKLISFTTLAGLAVALDEALSPEATEKGRNAARALEHERTPARILEAIQRERESHASRSKGLPRGLEFLDRDPTAALVRGLEPLTSRFVRKKEKDEAAIDAELAELKKRIRE